MTEATICLDGELIIKPNGVYTLAHFYEHPETMRMVTLIGMIHFGDATYYAKINKLIASADIIIFEASIHQEAEKINDTEKESYEQEELKKIYGESVEAAFFPALCLFFNKAQHYLKMVHESESFDAKKDNWVAGDGKFGELTKEKWQQEVDIMTQNLKNAPIEEKTLLCEFFKTGLSKIENKTLQKIDFVNGLVLMENYPWLQRVMDDAMIGRRDELTFETFDKIVNERSPNSVAIKFGAAHMSYQRRLLEQRKYIRKRSIELDAIAV